MSKLEMKKRHIPILFESEEECCGCTACFSICPVQAIDMNIDKKGFLYPRINTEICIKCNKCISVCPI